MARTTLDIDASVLRQLKKRKQKEHKTLGQLVSELLAQALADSKVDEPPPPLQWVSQAMGPKIDLDDKEAVWKILDGR